MRRRLFVVVLVGIALVTLGCDLRTTTPPGSGLVRYRDALFSGVTVTQNLTYGSVIDRQGNLATLKLDMYRPTGDTLTRRPAIVWVHGGSFSSGDKTSPELVDEANTFSMKGYVNVSINYRLSSTGCAAAIPTAECVNAIVDAKHDAQAAVRFLRANAATYGVDPDRIAIGGTSAGAITALDVGFDPTDPGASGNPGFSSAVDASVALSGAAIVVTIDPTDAPSLLFHGTADRIVPYQWAVDTVNNAHAAGLTSEITSYQGAGHVPYQNRNEILLQTTNFLYWTMDLSHAATT